MFDARWAFHNRQAEIDWGYRSVGETARVTKAIIVAYYEQQPVKSYFGSCSNGGRQAVMAPRYEPHRDQFRRNRSAWMDDEIRSRIAELVAERNAATDPAEYQRLCREVRVRPRTGIASNIRKRLLDMAATMVY